MKYNKLGRTDLSVSEICLGTMTWGTQNSEAEAHEQMDYAFDNGINFFDTAELYPTTPPGAETYGDTETIIGTWLQKSGKRQDLILASKIAGSGRSYIRDGRPITRETIREALDASLLRLKTDYLDLYQIHWPNRGTFHFRNSWKFDASKQDREQARTSFLEKLETLGELVKEGKIRAIGLSNESTWGTMRYLDVAEEKGLPRVATLQNEYNLLYRQFDLDLAEMSHHEDVGLLAYSPLGQGFLTGKYRNGARPAGARATLFDRAQRYEKPGAAEAINAYLDLAAEVGIDPAQLAIAFVLSRPFVTSAIIGATNLDQLATDIAAQDVSITPELESRIDAIHQIHSNPAP